MSLNVIEESLHKVLEFHNNRKVVIWSNCITSQKIAEKLRDDYGIETAFFVDNDSARTNNWNTYLPEMLRGRREEYFVVVPIGFHQSLKNQLMEYGYKKNEDYYYFTDCILEDSEDYYEDEHGNKVKGYHKGASFIFTSYNSVVEIGKRVTFNNVKMKIPKDTYVYIGDDSVLDNVFFDFMVGNIKCLIGNSVSMSKSLIRMACGSLLDIGDNVTAQNNLFIRRVGLSTVKIGKDCMFSYDVELRTGDGHSIFDVTDGRNINSTEEIRKNSKIIIGEHVWVGMNALLMNNAKIGSGSIIGAKSLVKKEIPNNCIAAGIPARVIRKNVSWSRKNGSEDIMDCGNDYISLTDESYER